MDLLQNAIKSSVTYISGPLATNSNNEIRISKKINKIFKDGENKIHPKV